MAGSTRLASTWTAASREVVWDFEALERQGGAAGSAQAVVDTLPLFSQGAAWLALAQGFAPAPPLR